MTTTEHTRPITVAHDRTHVWGAAEGASAYTAARVDAAVWLAGGGPGRITGDTRRDAARLDVATIPWPIGRDLPTGQDPEALQLAHEAAR